MIYHSSRIARVVTRYSRYFLCQRLGLNRLVRIKTLCNLTNRRSPSLPRTLAFLIIVLSQAACTTAPRVDANGETLTGKWTAEPGVAAFLGVPFAESPTGPLRWQAPHDYTGDGSARKATDFAPACMQSPRIVQWYRGLAEVFGSSPEVIPDLPISEDCLYLNIWSPDTRADAGLPVMVYVHGGSNISGWSWEPNYHGHVLAAQGVVVVTIAYRLGVFGFFSHPELAQNQAVANFGLWDQLAALRWVQKHIRRFGGDPSRVTVFGESLGAQDLFTLMLSPLAQHLFDSIIHQSAPSINVASSSLEEEMSRGVKLAEAFKLDSKNQLAALRRIPAHRLHEMGESVYADYYHQAVVDKQILQAPVSTLVDQGQFAAKQMIIGTNADEWYSYVTAPGAVDLNSDQREADPGRLALIEAIQAALVTEHDAVLAEVDNEHDRRHAIDRVITADQFLCPAQSLAERFHASGGRVWMYRFDKVRDDLAAAAKLKAYHGAELPYAFGTHDKWLPTNEDDLRLTEQVMAYWTQLAKTGNPNSPSLPTWPEYLAPGFQVQRLGEQVHPIPRPEPVLCDLYEQAIGEKR